MSNFVPSENVYVGGDPNNVGADVNDNSNKVAGNNSRKRPTSTRNQGNGDFHEGEVKHGKAWTPEEDHKVLEYVEIHGSRKSAWDRIAEHVPGRTAKTCRIRWWRFILPSLETHGVLQHPDPSNPMNPENVKKSRVWSKEEEDKLRELVRKYGVGNWPKVAAEMPGYGRSASACDLHWYLILNKVDPHVQNMMMQDGMVQDGLLIGPGQVGVEQHQSTAPPPGLRRKKWTDGDDEVLKQLVAQHGSTQSSWPIISMGMNRSELACRWRYNKINAQQLNGIGNVEAMAPMMDGGYIMPQQAGEQHGNQGQGDMSQQVGNVYGGNNAPAGAPQHLLLSHVQPAQPKSAPLKRRWSMREDEHLRQLVETRGTDSWATISQKLETGRSGDACQYHWQYELCPKLIMQQQVHANIMGEGDKSASSSADVPNAAGGPVGAGDPSGGDSSLYLLQRQVMLTNNSSVVLTNSNARPVAAHTYSANSRCNEWYKWTPDEDNMLKQLIQTYGCSGQAAWERIASQMPGRTLNSVRMRWKQALRPAVAEQLISGNMALDANTMNANNLNDIANQQQNQNNQQVIGHDDIRNMANQPQNQNNQQVIGHDDIRNMANQQQNHHQVHHQVHHQHQQQSHQQQQIHHPGHGGMDHGVGVMNPMGDGHGHGHEHSQDQGHPHGHPHGHDTNSHINMVGMGNSGNEMDGHAHGHPHHNHGHPHHGHNHGHTHGHNHGHLGNMNDMTVGGMGVMDPNMGGYMDGGMMLAQHHQAQQMQYHPVHHGGVHGGDVVHQGHGVVGMENNHHGNHANPDEVTNQGQQLQHHEQQHEQQHQQQQHEQQQQQQQQQLQQQDEYVQ